MNVELCSYYTAFLSQFQFDEICNEFVKENSPLVESMFFLGFNSDMTVSYKLTLNDKEYRRRKLTNSTMISYRGLSFRDDEIRILHDGD